MDSLVFLDHQPDAAAAAVVDAVAGAAVAAQR
jgi:hypothetical protein